MATLKRKVQYQPTHHSDCAAALGHEFDCANNVGVLLERRGVVACSAHDRVNCHDCDYWLQKDQRGESLWGV